MDAERWKQVKHVLDGSLDKDSEELAAWLDETCAGDSELRGLVADLLSYDDRLDTFSAAAPLGRWLAEEESAVGRRIGPYRLSELLGRGGMGAVYRAERIEGFHQTVALKVMRTGIESPQALERFHREREILARLEHPHIARLLDGGTSGEGRPYFAMELVEGVPIDRYCDDQRLTTRQRLELLLTVCGALQFAHRNLVIHRDLKPGNILVNHDGAPKLLDFGIAKLMSPEVGATEISGQAMTPRYASPEQLLEEPISTASDVYSLGVVLYRLLTGRLPCGLDTCSRGRVVYAVCEEEPRPPSEAVQKDARTRHGDDEKSLTPQSVAADRGTIPRALQRRLRGDLDAIVLKALRKEPEHRYASMDQLASDLRRHLGRLPVRARRGTLAYRTGKYVRRHRWGLTTVAAVLALTLGFTAVLVRQLEHTEKQRDRAARVSSFLVDLFRAAEPDRTSAEPSVRSLVDTGRQRLDHDLADVPDVRADLLNTLGQVYERLGHYDSAVETLETSLRALRQLHARDHADVARALNDLSVLAYRHGDYPRAEIFSRECIAMRERLGLEEDLIKPRNNLAAILRLRGRLDEAEDLYRQGLEQRRARWGDRHPNVAVSLSSLAITLYLAGDLDGAEPLLREALEIRLEAYEPGSAKVAEVLGHLARLHHARGELDDADRLYSQALRIRRQRLGHDHPRVGTLEKDFAALLLERGEVDTADVVLSHALGVLYAHKPQGDPILAEAESVYGAYLAARGRRAEAEICLRSSFETLEAVRGPDVLPTRQARRRLEAWADTYSPTQRTRQMRETGSSGSSDSGSSANISPK